MDVFDAVRTVLAIRAYQDWPISAEIVQKIVEAGRLTGSSICIPHSDTRSVHS